MANATLHTATLGAATVFTGEYTLTKATGTTFKFSTQDKYSDKDIILNTKVQAGAPTEHTADVTCTTNNISNVISSTGTTSAPSSGYYIGMKGSGSSKISTAGWMNTGALPTSSTTKYFTVQAAQMTGTANDFKVTTTVQPGAVTISTYSASLADKIALDSLEPVQTTTSIDTYYIPLRAKTTANTTGTTTAITGTHTASISTAGFAPTTLKYVTDLTGIATAKTSTRNSNPYYIPIPTAVFTTTDNVQECSSGGWVATGTTFADAIAPGTITNPYNYSGNDYELIERGQYVKVGAGAYNNDIYFLAEPNEGTQNISSYSNSAVEVDGAQYVTLNMCNGELAHETLIDTTNTNITINSSNLAPGSDYYLTLNCNTNFTINTAGWLSTDQSDTSTCYFSIASGEVTPICETSQTATFFDIGSSQNYSISITPQYTSQEGYIADIESPESGDTQYLSIITTEPSFSGGALASTGATAMFTNSTVSDINSSGIAITTSATATRTAVTYDTSDAGWLSAKTSNDVALAAASATTWTGNTYYLTGVELTNNNEFEITVPNGEGNTITFHFAVDDNGNTTITEG